MTADLGLRSELIDATPGEPLAVVVDLTNPLTTASRFQIRVVGAAAEWAGTAQITDWLEPGARTAVELTVVLPLGFPTGDHLLGIESVPLNADGTPSPDQTLRRVADLTISVGSLAGLHAVLEPRNVTGRRRLSLTRLDPRTYRRGLRPSRARNGRAVISLRNRSFEPIHVSLSATSPGEEVAISFDQTETVIEPGRIVGVQAKVRASRPLWGRTRRRPFTVIARSTGHQIYLEGSHSQTAWIRPGALKGVGILTVFALWAGTLALVYDRVIQEDAPADTAEQAGADGGTSDGTDGNGSDDGAGGNGSGGAGGEGEEASVRDLSISAAPVEASGQVSAREPQGVRVRIRSVSLVDEISPDATLVSAPPGSNTRGVKLLGRRGGMIYNRIVPAEVSTTTDDEGRWAVAGLSGPGFFEVRFTKPGYATRAYVVEMPEDGSPISLDTELVAGDGSISGVVLGRNGALGDVDITITDGTLTFATTTPTTGAVGSWSVEGLTTPGTYLVTARRRGYATATELVRLGGGQAATGVNMTLSKGTGTITGMIRSTAGPLNDITITASGEDVERTTTSLTQNPVGTFSLPELPRPGIYTLTVSAEGWLTQTMEVRLDGDETEANISMVARTGIAYGRVTDTTGAGLGGVGITAVSEDFTYKNTTAPDGQFELVGLEPGSYVIEFNSFEHHTGSSLITIGSGTLREVNVSLSPRDTLEPPPNNSLTFSFSAEGNITVTERTTGVTASTGGGSSASFANLPAGVRTFDITGVGFQPATVQFRMGLTGPFSTSVTLKPLVVVNIKITDIQGSPLQGATVVVRRTADSGCPPDSTTPGCRPFEGVTDTQGVARSDNGAGGVPELTDGNWQAEVSMLGYQIETQNFVTNYDTGAVIDVPIVVQKLPQLSLNIREPRLDTNGTVSFPPVDDVHLRLVGTTVDGNPIEISDWPDAIDNRYTLAAIPPGDYQVEMSRPGYRTAWFPETGVIQLRLNDELIEDPVLTRIPDATSGRVVWDRAGILRPIQGATVTITGTRTFTTGAVPSPIPGTWVVNATDNNGWFTFEGDEGPIFGDATITITHPDHHDFDIDGDPNTPNIVQSNTDLGDLVLAPLPGTITQRVYLDFGAGTADNIGDNVRLEVLSSPPDEDVFITGSNLTPAGSGFDDAVGRYYADFTLNDAYPGDYQFRYSYLPSGGGDLNRFTPVTTSSSALDPNRVLTLTPATMAAQAQITGQVFSVIDTAGNSPATLGGATVELRHAGGGPVTVTEGTNPVVLGSGESVYSFVALDAGQYELVVTRDGYTSAGLDSFNPPTPFTLGTGAQADLGLVMRPLSTISFGVDGQRFDGSSIQVPGDPTVTVTQPGSPDQIDVEWDPDQSRYVVTGLDAEAFAGPVTILLEAPGYDDLTYVLGGDGSQGDIGLDWGDQRHLGNLTMQELPGQIALTLRSTGSSVDLSQAQHDLVITLYDAQGNVVPGVVFTPSDTVPGTNARVWTTGDLQPGQYSIKLNAHNHAPLDVADVEGNTTITVQGGVSTPVNAALFSGRSTVTGTVTLTVAGGSYTDYSDAVVQLLDEDGEPVLDDSDQPLESGLNAQGQFTISGVDDGRYHLAASRPGFTPFETSAMFEVDPPESNNTRVFNFTTEVEPINLPAILHNITVHVTSAVGGDVEGASVQLVPDPQYTPGTAFATSVDTTDEAGLANFTGVRPGHYVIEVDSENSEGDHLDATDTLAIPFQDAAPGTASVVIPEARLTGWVSIADAANSNLNGSTVSVYTVPTSGSPVLFRTITFSGLASGVQLASYSMFVPPGNLRVVANGAASANATYIPATATVNGVTSGQSPTAGTQTSPLAIIEEARVSVVIRELGTNNNINGATITWTRSGGGSASVTDGGTGDADGSANGTISLSQLRPGTYDFTLVAGTGYATVTVDDITLGYGSNPNVVLNSVAHSTLRIDFSGSNAGGNAFQVRLTPGANGTAAPSVHGNLTTNNASTRTISNVRTGNGIYTVEVCRGGVFGDEGTGDCPAGEYYGVTNGVTVARNTNNIVTVNMARIPVPTTTTEPPPTTAPATSVP